MNKTMRTMVIALVAMFTLAANAQVVTKDSLYVLKPGSVIGFYFEENAHNSGFDMIYLRLSLETITNGQYRINENKHSLWQRQR